MGKRGNPGSNVSDESWRDQRWEGRDRGSQHRSCGGKSIAARPAIGAAQAETARAASQKRPSSGSAAQSAIQPGHHIAAYCSSSGSAHNKAHRADGEKSIGARPAIGAPQADSKRIELKPAPQRTDGEKSIGARPAIGGSQADSKRIELKPAPQRGTDSKRIELKPGPRHAD